MFNSKKIKALERDLKTINFEFREFKKENRIELDRLSFLLENPIQYKIGDKPFKDIVITSVECAYNMMGYGFLGRASYSWQWEIKAFDSKNKRELYLKLDCGNKLINPNL